MKAMKKKPVFPDSKRGKRRVQRRPAANKKYTPVAYVRHGVPATKNRGHRARWGRSIQEWMLSPSKLLQKLLKDKILSSWKGKHCPRCGKGVMGPLKFFKDKKLWAHRCNHRYCHKLLQPHDFHLLHVISKSSTPLSKQVAALYCAVAGVSCQSAHLVPDMDHKAVERIYANLDVARADYVTKQERNITYGGAWQDTEVDEVDIGKLTDETIEHQHNTTWEQWGGLVERGQPIYSV